VAASGQAAPARPFLLLHHVLKELATKRLPADTRIFESTVAAALFDPVFAAWCADTSALGACLSAAASSPSAPLPPHAEVLEQRWALELKALRRLAVFSSSGEGKGGQQTVWSPFVCRAAPACASACDAFRALTGSQPVAGSAERCCVRLLKCAAHMQSVLPLSFHSCGALRASVQAAVSDIVAVAPRTPPATVLVRHLRLMTSILTCGSYRPVAPPGSLAPITTSSSSRSADEAPALRDAKAAAWAELQSIALSGGGGHALVGALVTCHLMLTPAELEAWDENAEEYHQDCMSRTSPDALGDVTGDGGGAADDAAPAAQALLVALVQAERTLAPHLAQRLWAQATTGSCAGTPGGGSADSQLLATDAALHAFGATTYELHDDVDFGSWWSHVIEPCLVGVLPCQLAQTQQAQPHALGKALRRRAAWVCGQWVAKATPQLRPHMYSRLTHLLSPANEPDAAVRLAAAGALRTLVDDFGFEVEPFSPFIPAALDGLFTTATQCCDADAAAQSFTAARCVVDALGDSVLPHADAILRGVAPLWNAGHGASLLRMQVLGVLARTVAAMGSDSPRSWQVVLPLLCISADPGHPESDILFDDVAVLWHATLRHAPAWDASLLAPLPQGLANLERSWEHLPTLCRILTSYLLLEPGATLQAVGTRLADRLAAAVGDVTERGLLLLLPVADAAVRSFPGATPRLLDACLAKLVRMCVEQAPNDNGVGDVSDALLARACCVLGRVLVQNTEAGLDLLARASAAGLGRGDAVLAFMDAWLERQDRLSQPSSRKLLALALCTLLASGHAAGLARLEDAAACVTGVLAEEAAAIACGDGLLDGYDPILAADGAEDAGNTPWDDAGLDILDEGAEAARKQAALEGDPVRRAALGATFTAALEAAAARHGADAVRAALGRVDATVAGQLARLGVMLPGTVSRPGMS